MSLLAPLKFKDYVWPHNPSTYEMKYVRDIVQHKYPQIYGAELEDFAPNARVFTGSGAFNGPDAYDEFHKLADIFYSVGPGKLIHPNWMPVDVIFTSLNLKQEPTPNYVEYSFEFVEHKRIQIIKEVVKPSTKNTNSSSKPTTNIWKGTTLKKGSKGASVKELQTMLQKVGYSPGKIDSVYGVKTEEAVKRFQKSVKIKVDGIAGKTTFDKLNSKLGYTTASKTSSSNTTKYTVKSGDKLVVIANKFGVNYKAIADANKKLIKDPNQLKVGWVLTIPKR